MNAPTRPTQTQARFTQGSTMRHVIEMTVTGAIGLMALFFVDFLSLFYISQLGDDRLTAGVGYAATLMFLAMSVSIGTMIAGTALVSRALGAEDRDEARRHAASATGISAVLGLLVSIAMLLFVPQLLDLTGATGVPKEVATRFLYIVIPANTLMAIGMMLSGVLRAIGDAKRAMMVTLMGGIVTAVLDPLLIFGLKLGTDGAAIATVFSRLVFMAVGFYGVVHIHKLMQMPRIADMLHDFRSFSGIAVPAVLTNLATPVGDVLYLRILAPFGAEAIAANAVFSRLIPLTFGALFALSASVGPILGQNLGARRFDRLNRAMRDAFVFAGLYTLGAWLILALLRNQIVQVFSLDGLTAQYVAYFCIVGGVAWIFVGFVLVANAAFNNLGFPLYSTVFNWGRATLGLVPFTYIGAMIAGVEGAVAGLALGALIFGIAAIVVAFRVVRGLEAKITAEDARSGTA
jgi:putative MATE family efflux protein